MTSYCMQFDAVAEAQPGPQWLERWHRSWPAYRQWFIQRGGDRGPSRAECEAALTSHMPELLPTWRALCRLAGNGDREARFLSTWCPPPYLGNCSIAALTGSGQTRLVRNYDLSPTLNEGLLLRSEWTGKPVMAMIEFLWGVSDGINEQGLALALAFGGRNEVAEGFGITTVLRYVLECCATVNQALEVLQRVPSHMAYNIVLADRHGRTASVEMQPGGGLRDRPQAIATNHQHGDEVETRPEFTQTRQRYACLQQLLASSIAPDELRSHFLRDPLFQRNYAGGLGTLFTVDYEPDDGSLTLCWPDQVWQQSLTNFESGSRTIRLQDRTPTDEQTPVQIDEQAPVKTDEDAASNDRWLDAVHARAIGAADPAELSAWLRDAREGRVDWQRFGKAFVIPVDKR